MGISREDGKAWASVRASYLAYDLVRESWATSDKLLAMVGPVYFMVTVAPSPQASCLAAAAPTADNILLKMAARGLVLRYKEHSQVIFRFYLRVKQGPFSGFWNLTYPNDTTEGGQV